MDTRRLAAFVRVVDVGSITSAARTLYIAQPALSQQVSALERTLGCRLLLRSTAGVVPTAAGQALYRHARKILSQQEKAVREVVAAGSLGEATGAAQPQDGSTRVTVGLVPGAGSTLAGDLLRGVGEGCPGITVWIEEACVSFADAVADGRIDMAVAYDRSLGDGAGAHNTGHGYDLAPSALVRRDPLLAEDLVLVTPSHGPPRDGVSTFSVDLGDQDLLLPAPGHPLRPLIDAELATYDVRPAVIAEFDTLGTLLEAVRVGVGSTVLPRSVARHASTDLRSWSIGASSRRLTLCVLSPAHALRSPAAAVLAVLREVAYGLRADASQDLRWTA